MDTHRGQIDAFHHSLPEHAPYQHRAMLTRRLAENLIRTQMPMYCMQRGVEHRRAMALCNAWVSREAASSCQTLTSELFHWRHLERREVPLVPAGRRASNTSEETDGEGEGEVDGNTKDEEEVEEYGGSDQTTPKARPLRT